MAHRFYLYNVDGVADRDGSCLEMVEWAGEFPSLLSPLLSGGPFLGRNRCNDTGEADGIYAAAPDGKALMEAFYGFLERHANHLVDDLPAFRKAKHNILAFLANRAVHSYFHVDGWDRFNLSDEPHATQAAALLERIQRDNARIREAIEADDPQRLESCEGWQCEEEGSFRALLNASHYDYGWDALTSAIYDQADIFEEHGKQGLRSVAGELLIPPTYDEIGDFDAWNIAIVREGDRFGYIALDGHRLTPVEFAKASSFGGVGFALVAKEGAFGVIDPNGRQVIPCEHEAMQAFSYRVGAAWAACKSGHWGVIDIDNDWRLPPAYERVEVEGGAFFATRAGQPMPEVYTRQYVLLGTFPADQLVQFMPKRPVAGSALKKVDGPIQYWPPAVGDARPLLDAYGAIVLALGPDDALEHIPDEPFYIVRQAGLYGLFDAVDPRWLLPCAYADMKEADDLTSYEDREAGWVPVMAKQDSHWGVFQAAPEPGWLISPVYDDIKPFRDHRLLCQTGELWGLVDRSGTVICAPRYTTIWTADVDGSWIATGFRDGGVFALLADGGERPLSRVEAQNVLELFSWLGRVDEDQRQALEHAAGSTEGRG